jgi:hypothetical protein
VTSFSFIHLIKDVFGHGAYDLQEIAQNSNRSHFQVIDYQALAGSIGNGLKRRSSHCETVVRLQMYRGFDLRQLVFQ